MRWAAEDVDEDDRVELQRVLASAMAGDESAKAELADRLAGPLTFGTAGLRGPLRAGPNGMNRSVVIRATAGVAAWLTAHGHAGGVVVVGRDARHGSERFATDAAGVLAAAGFDTRLLPGPLPTPLLAGAVRRLGAVAGIQITASHNPPADNGYKLYDGEGTQIVPPADSEVEAAIERVGPAFTVPLSQGWRVEDRDLLGEYLAHVGTLPRGSARDLRIAATPMHGVGGEPLVRALAAAGFHDVHLVPEQAEPDPDFSTVAFPNPEEPGATDLLLALAERVEADLAIALDPDADRCAVGTREPGGGWRMLRGDETGVLLAEHVLAALDRAAHPDPLVATTIVSSSMLASVAAAHDARYDETLTGFKWLVRAGDGRGTGLVFAYEEALGLSVDPEVVRDKDGLSAAVLAADLAATRKAEGSDLLAALDELAARHGVHLTDQVSIRVTDQAERARLVAGVRGRPPAELAGVPVSLAEPRAADIVELRAQSLRVVIRPSGTEPKLKAYLQVVEPVADAAPDGGADRSDRVAAARERAEARLTELRDQVAELLR
ncbi:phospho-sugar mutase [Actinoalloteichus sp. AHMU CJ021]|nr:phospho-sugar mutase [Actinoalloteichus caeruleus]AUS81748.1 phospho-sugar mutase [Actinoalloteichus sp. AHMU CJ021]